MQMIELIKYDLSIEKIIGKKNLEFYLAIVIYHLLMQIILNIEKIRKRKETINNLFLTICFHADDRVDKTRFIDWENNRKKKLNLEFYLYQSWYKISHIITKNFKYWKN